MLTDKKQLPQKIKQNRRNIPPLDDLPSGEIDWEEVSEFILVDLDNGGLYWHYLNDESKTAKLSENSLAVLRLIKHDMFDLFFYYITEPEWFDQWGAMEKNIRQKYGKLSEKLC